MKDLSRIKQNEKGYYIEYVHKSGRQKGYIGKYCGKVLTCPFCKEPYFATNSNIKKGRGKTCSSNCWASTRKEKLNPNWKGGKKKCRGYVLIKKSKHPFGNFWGYVPEHRLIMEKRLGRYLKPKERIHHKNSIKDDNRIENLKLFKNNKEHRRIHMIGKNSPNWRGGSSKIKSFSNTKVILKLKELIRKRDDYTCRFPKCKQKQNGRLHSVHHIDYNKSNLNPMNLITLCHKHNSKVNFNREYWMNYFLKIIKIKYKEENVT